MTALPICPASQYMRIEAAAGGVTASRLAILRAARRLILPELRSDPDHREARHNWFRSILEQHDNAKGLARAFRLTHAPTVRNLPRQRQSTTDAELGFPQ